MATVINNKNIAFYLHNWYYLTVALLKKYYPEIILFSSFIIYGLWFIYRTSFLIDGKRYFCLFDDAMISLAYAKNLLNGYGLNWAKFGNPVEGYTHPLWVFFMVVTSFFVRNDALRSLPIQLLSLLFLVLNLMYIRKILIARYTTSNKFYALPALVLTAFYYPLVSWSLQGMETGFQSLLIVSSLYYFLNFHDGKYFDLIKLSVLLSLSLLLRMDMIIFVGLVTIYAAFTIAKSYKKISLKYVLVSLAIIIIPNLLYIIFRYFYFHDLLPNTYYLKMTGYPVIPRIMRGMSVFIDFLKPVLIPITLIFAYSLKNIHKINIQLPFFTILLYFAYTIYVGGDAWDASSIGANRFEVVVIPLIFILLSSFLYDLFISSKNLTKTTKGVELFLSPLNYYFSVFVTLWFFISFNGLGDTLTWKDKWQNLLVLNPPLYTVSNSTVIPQILSINAKTDKDALVAFVGAGIPGFFGNFRLVDIMGYNNSRIAKQSTRLQYTVANYNTILPGHMKFDYEYLMKKLKVDIFPGYYGADHPVINAQFLELAQKYGYVNRGYWVREGTTHYFEP